MSTFCPMCGEERSVVDGNAVCTGCFNLQERREKMAWEMFLAVNTAVGCEGSERGKVKWAFGCVVAFLEEAEKVRERSKDDE